MLKYDQMTPEQLNSALYFAEVTGNWQEADDIAVYMQSMDLDSTSEVRENLDLWNGPVQGIASVHERVA